MYPVGQFPARFVVHMPLCLHVLLRVAGPLHSNRGRGGRHLGYVPLGVRGYRRAQAIAMQAEKGGSVLAPSSRCLAGGNRIYYELRQARPPPTHGSRQGVPPSCPRNTGCVHLWGVPSLPSSHDAPPKRDSYVGILFCFVCAHGSPSSFDVSFTQATVSGVMWVHAAWQPACALCRSQGGSRARSLYATPPPRVLKDSGAGSATNKCP